MRCIDSSLTRIGSEAAAAAKFGRLCQRVGILTVRSRTRADGIRYSHKIGAAAPLLRENVPHALGIPQMQRKA
jgi:hypothetical protein